MTTLARTGNVASKVVSLTFSFFFLFQNRRFYFSFTIRNSVDVYFVSDHRSPPALQLHRCCRPRSQGSERCVLFIYVFLGRSLPSRTYRASSTPLMLCRPLLSVARTRESSSAMAWLPRESMVRFYGNRVVTTFVARYYC